MGEDTMRQEHPTGAPPLVRDNVTAGRTVLIVDDEADLVDTCFRLLVARGYVCARADTGGAAITLIDEGHPDLVLSDFQLPDVDGLAVLAHARAKTPAIPGILMTAYKSARTVKQAGDSGPLGYLAKPFSASELIAAVKAALP